MGIILAILLFSAIVIFHELGHFLLAKKNKIRVDEFSLGLGPTIFGKQFGETKFSLKLLPFGGACMMGEDDVDDMSEGSFNSKSVWARMSVIVAGPVFNLILAWILCMIIIGWTGYRAPIVSNVTDGYSAQEEGIEPGDVIKKIGGKSVHIWNDISLYNMMHAGTKSVEVKYERDGKDYTVVLEPKQNEGDAFPLLGITGGEMVRPGLFGTVRYGAYTVKYWITYTVDSLKMLISGKRILFLGDMGWQAGEDFLANHTQEELKSDVLQMAHHGQRGVEEELYQEISPEVCLWPTPDWLWDNVQDGVAGAGSYKTPIVRGWMVTLGVKKNLCVKDGDQILR